MAWTKFWDGMWYNDATGEQRATTGDPNQEDAANAAAQPQWVREGWRVVSGDPSGSGVSQTAVINPATGQAETLIEVASAPGPNGIRQSLGSMPFSEYQARLRQDPTITIARSTPSPENSMLQSSLGSQIMEGIRETAPVAAGMLLPGVISPYLSSLLGTSPLLSNALASAGTSALTGGDPLQSALSSLAVGGLGNLGASAGSGVDFSALDANPSGAISGVQTFPLQVAGGTYGGNTTMSDVTPQVNYGLSGTEMLGNGLQLPSGSSPNVLGTGGANPESNMGFNTAGVNTGANSTIGQGFNANAFAPDFGGIFNTDGITISAANPAANLGTGGTTAPVSTPTATGGFQMPPAPLLGAGALGLAALGTGANTVTSSGDVDLTGVGSGTGGTPSPTDAESNSAIARILAGTATPADWARVAGQALPGLISAYGSSQQANNQRALTEQLLGYGAPSRARYEASMTPGFDPNTIPGYSAAVDNSSNAILRRLSTQGNPFGNPGGLIEANKQVVAGTALPAIQQYQNQNANTGGIGALSSQAPGSAQNAIGAGNNVWSDLGSSFSSVMNPQPDFADMLRRLSASGSGVLRLA